MSIIIEHRITTSASPETVWQVVTDFDRYSQWNPFVVGCECDLQVGNPIIMQVVLGEGKSPREQTEYVSAVGPGMHFAYTSPKNPGVLLRSYRSHDVEVENGSTVYRSRFELHGWLVPLLKLVMQKPLQWGFDQMSQGIVDRAELLQREQTQSPAE